MKILKHFKKINITKSYYGLVAKDYSDVKVNDLTILESENCLSVYSKKQEFSGASILINNFRCEPLNLKNKNIYSDELSKIKINTAI